MRAKTVIGIFVFALGLLLLLTRPCFACRIRSCNGSSTAGTGVRLQQPVNKKKDDHHEDPLCTGMAVPAARMAIDHGRKPLVALPVILLLLFRPVTISDKHPACVNAFFQRHRYRLVGCLLI